MFELLVNVEDMRDDDSAVQAGLALASRHGAFLTGLNIVQMDPSTMAMPDVVAVADLEEEEAKARDAWWVDRCRKSGVDGAWEVIRGMFVPVLARRSCMADITVSKLPNGHDGSRVHMDQLTRLLFFSASPMLLVPDAHKEPDRMVRIVVAWNSTEESMHALHAALPLLREAEKVFILDGSSNDLPGLAPPPLPVYAWLKRQGIAVHAVQEFSTSSCVGELLLGHAEAMQADLLVMGAWGHSRINEFILGGTTRHVLQHARLPVLMAH